MPKGTKAHFNKQQAGVKCVSKNGKTFTLLNPYEKGCKSAVELRTGRNVYTGATLTDTQKAYRSGYLTARKDSAKCYNASKKTPR